MPAFGIVRLDPRFEPLRERLLLLLARTALRIAERAGRLDPAGRERVEEALRPWM